MAHILDNPIWHALNEGNKLLAMGDDKVKIIRRDIGFFAGFARNNQHSIKQLANMLPASSQVILFQPKPINIPTAWNILADRPLLQMVYPHQHLLSVNDADIKPLNDCHISAMLKLTAMTNPGPFLTRTIEFGNYEGIFKGRQLVAMIGHRLQPEGYIEVSAVCTHPKYTGNGLAARLIANRTNDILQQQKIPFLHAYPDNPAVHLYRKLGFVDRKLLRVYFLEKC